MGEEHNFQKLGVEIYGCPYNEEIIIKVAYEKYEMKLH